MINGLTNLEKKVPRIQGITDYSFHKCEVIVNTTLNLEGKFSGSGGLSGFIATRTGSVKNDIQREIEKNINKFNSKLVVQKH